MNIELLKTLLPVVLDLINSFHRDNNRVPTYEELEQLVEDDLTKFIMIGDKWLAEHPQKSSDSDSLTSTGNNS